MYIEDRLARSWEWRLFSESRSMAAVLNSPRQIRIC